MSGTRVDDAHAIEVLRKIFEERISFNQVLGLKLESVSHDAASFRFEMQDKLVGNYERGILHGGVICSALDVAAGVLAYMRVAESIDISDDAQVARRFSKIGTIDLRVDFLRPGYGDYFIASATILRSGSRVAVMRTDLVNDAGDHIASGACTYILS